MATLESTPALQDFCEAFFAKFMGQTQDPKTEKPDPAKNFYIRVNVGPNSRDREPEINRTHAVVGTTHDDEAEWAAKLYDIMEGIALGGDRTRIWVEAMVIRSAKGECLHRDDLWITCKGAGRMSRGKVTAEIALVDALAGEREHNIRLQDKNIELFDRILAMFEARQDDVEFKGWLRGMNQAGAFSGNEQEDPMKAALGRVFERRLDQLAEIGIQRIMNSEAAGGPGNTAGNTPGANGATPGTMSFDAMMTAIISGNATDQQYEHFKQRMLEYKAAVEAAEKQQQQKDSTT